MNRELKLALIVGFSLVLVVAVLISDHLSSARKAAMANLVNDVPAVVNSGSISGPGELRVPGQPAPTAPVLTPPANPMGELQNPATPPSQTELVAASTPDAAQAEPLSSGPLAGNISVTPEPLVIRQGSGTSLHNSGEAPTVSPEPLGTRITPPGPATSTPAEPARDFSKDRRHSVARGDSLISITRKYYGDSSLHKALAEYNKGRVGSDGVSLREGVTLFIPTRNVLTGAPAPAPGLTPAPKPETKPEIKPEPKPETKPAPVRTYTVKRGDSLAKIAQSQLGSSKRVGELLKLNGLADADDIKVGQVLKIPAR